VNTAATVYIVLGLFLLGGVYSFWKQKLPKSVILLLGLSAAASLTAGFLNL
jgi:hypothetical protein